ncbi:MAG: 4Fe-4S ferredoxin [Crenarchaeota archaeon]|nr:4Fe-4S ferredoxin [Thermoproteota archaeon]
MARIRIDPGRCRRCGACASTCIAPRRVLEIGEDGEPRVVDESACIECLRCALICPSEAIDIEVSQLSMTALYDGDAARFLERLF